MILGIGSTEVIEGGGILKGGTVRSRFQSGVRWLPARGSGTLLLLCEAELVQSDPVTRAGPLTLPLYDGWHHRQKDHMERGHTTSASN